jgi:hypothetical protein
VLGTTAGSIITADGLVRQNARHDAQKKRKKSAYPAAGGEGTGRSLPVHHNTHNKVVKLTLILCNKIENYHKIPPNSFDRSI